MHPQIRVNFPRWDAVSLDYLLFHVARVSFLWLTLSIYIRIVHTLQADFTQSLDLPSLDGLLMANSLHFVRDKEPLLRRLCGLLRPGGRLVIVEYNTRRGNSAVPYPLDDAEFLSLAARVGLVQPEIRVRAPSSFLGEMYTGVALRTTHSHIAPDVALL